MRMLAAALLALLAPETIVPKSWLVIEPVDKAGRRPLRPDAVFARHLLARDAAAPAKGEVLRGENEKDCAWTEAQAKDDGTLEGRIGWAYTAVDAAADGVWMAKLSGASQLYVNGAGFVGDVYGYGFGGVPVALKKGHNDVYVGGVRGTLRLEFWQPESGLFIATWDTTLPDVVDRQDWPLLPTPAAALLVNATERNLPVRFWSGQMQELRLPPLSIAKLRFVSGFRETSNAIAPQPAPASGTKLTIWVKALSEPLHQEREFQVTVRSRTDARRSTFVSADDDSVQEYALRPASEKQQAVVLSLHGAGVDCMGQVNAYSPKPEFTILAPTNRRPYGFDWQDWGRTNAYEALRAEFGSIPATLYLTGHSMGGHGTWSLAANDPDAFAAIAPSAGWASFDSYGGRPKGALAELWHAADGTSNTLALLPNLAQLPTYILHGTADDNVPVTEAQAMEKALTDAGHPPRSHYQEGAGHWWDGDKAPGADCVDWPEIFELFRASKPRGRGPESHFLTVDPSVDSTDGIVTVLQLERYGEPAQVTLRRPEGGGAPVVESKNVRLLQLEGQPKSVPRGEKSPEFSGPFKRAFRRHFVLVYGTQGTPEENRELYERARCDSEIWWYRGNGRGQLVSDTEYLDIRRGEANAILYGNAETNLVWHLRVPKDAPLQVHRGRVKLGEREWQGEDLCALAVQPSTMAGELFGLVGSTGVAGTRLGYTTAYFVSGVGYPDYTVFGSDVLQQGDGGVRAAGWYDAQWRLDGRGFLAPAPK